MLYSIEYKTFVAFQLLLPSLVPSPMPSFAAGCGTGNEATLYPHSRLTAAEIHADSLLVLNY